MHPTSGFRLATALGPLAVLFVIVIVILSPIAGIVVALGPARHVVVVEPKPAPSRQLILTT